MQLIGRVLLLALCVFSAYSLPNTISAVKEKASVESVISDIENFLHNHFGSHSNSTNNNSTSGNNTINNGTNPNNNSTNNNSTNCNDLGQGGFVNSNCTNNNSTNNNSTNNDNNNSTNSNNTLTVALCYKNFNLESDAISQQTINLTENCYKINETVANNTRVNCDTSLATARSARLQRRLSVCSSQYYWNVFTCYVDTYEEDVKELDQIRKQSGLCLPYLEGDNASEVERAQRHCVSTVVTDAKTKSLFALNALEVCLNRVQNVTVAVQAPAVPVNGN